MPPKKGGGGKKTAAGYKMPAPLSAGTVLTDLSKKNWCLGKSIGKGGFGELYLANEQGGKGLECVVKIEPHENGPLFVEMHYYLSAGKPEHLSEWAKTGGKGRKPHLPLLRGSGSHMHQGEKYRFLVIDRLGPDLDKTFQNGESPLDVSTVSNLALQVLDCLEYIHSRGYTHNDVKAANLLSGLGSSSNQMFLVDFGLVVKFLKGEGNLHKEYRADPRKAHDGTIEYLSRDAHIGCTARRSDLENLSLCLYHWSTGSLPWLSLIKGPPTKVQAAKEKFFQDLPSSLPPSLPAPVKDFILYVAALKFEEAPNYDHCREIFTKAAKAGAGGLKLAAKPEAVTNGKKKRFDQDQSEEDIFGNGDSEEMDVDDSATPSKRTKKAPVKKTVKTKKTISKNRKEPVVEMGNGDNTEDDDDDVEEYTPKPSKRRGPVNKVALDVVVSSRSSPRNSPARASNKGTPRARSKSPSLPRTGGPLAKKAATQTAPSSDEDMFAASPPNLLRTKNYSEAASQTSPAFVAASKAARRAGKAALAASEGREPATGGKGREKDTNGKYEANGEDELDNPTPAMRAILEKRKAAEEEGKKRKNTAGGAPTKKNKT